MKIKSKPNRKIQLAFGSAIAMLLVMGALSYRSVVASNESSRWVQHTNDVLKSLQQMVFGMEAISSSMRRFVITGEESDLNNYRAAKADIARLGPVLRQLTSDNPEQLARLPILEKLAAGRAERAESLINLRRIQGIEAAMESVRNGPTHQVTGEYKAVVGQLQDEELRLLALRTSDLKRHSDATRIILLLGTALAVLITAGAGWEVQRDSARRELAEEALFAEKERAQVTLNSIGDAVVCTDISGNLTFFNAVAENLTGWPWREAAGRPMGDILRILNGASRETIPDPMALAIELNLSANLPANCVLVRRDGSEIPIEDSVAPIHDREGEPIGAVMVFRDVSLTRAMALEIAHAAKHDFLTGLPNRMLLSDRIGLAIASAMRNRNKIAVLFLDLDGFKLINDSLGHPVGDKLLQSVAARLADCVRDSDTVSRQGGDEFVVLLADVQQLDHVDVTARRMLKAVAEAHSIDLRDLHVTASIGVSIYPDDGLNAETLIRNADTAMYQAKQNGRQSIKFFKPAMSVVAVERQFLEESLRRALERQEFSLHYQPKIHLKTGTITGAEALIRWTHPTRGPISPARFIPIAEDSGLILPIGAWVLREACTQARAWADAGLPTTSMAVNVSAVEFRSASFLEGLFATLSETGLDPNCLELELTESVLMTQAESATFLLQTLRQRGVHVAIDDFGTGYSSLSYLHNFPVDALKIDQSFIRQIGTDRDNMTIATAVIGMARDLNLRVIAEGVETPEEVAFLQAHHCDEAQGYYFSPAVPPQQFAKLLGSVFHRRIA
jgi:diguanylate cyclase (GGDEF)-like protein/PAS domain S-box-containing protein